MTLRRVACGVSCLGLPVGWGSVCFLFGLIIFQFLEYLYTLASIIRASEETPSEPERPGSYREGPGQSRGPQETSQTPGSSGRRYQQYLQSSAFSFLRYIPFLEWPQESEGRLNLFPNINEVATEIPRAVLEREMAFSNRVLMERLEPYLYDLDSFYGLYLQRRAPSRRRSRRVSRRTL